SWRWASSAACRKSTRRTGARTTSGPGGGRSVAGAGPGAGVDGLALDAVTRGPRAGSRRGVRAQSIAPRPADHAPGPRLEPEEHGRGIELEDLVGAVAIALDVHARVAQPDDVGRAHAPGLHLVGQLDRVHAGLVLPKVDRLGRDAHGTDHAAGDHVHAHVVAEQQLLEAHRGRAQLVEALGLEVAGLHLAGGGPARDRLVERLVLGA